MKKNKIVHIISSLKIGGAELMLCDIIRGLEDYEHVVLFFHEGPVKIQLQEQGIICISIQKKLYLYDPWFIYNLIKTVKHQKPKVILSSLWAANFLARIIGKLLDIPTLNVIHAQPMHEGYFRNFLDSVTLRLAHAVITVSESIRTSILTKRWVPAQSLHTISNGIGITTQSTKITRNSLGLNDNDFVVGCVGRLVPVKNFSLLIQIMRKLQVNYAHLKVLIVGNGPLLIRLQEEIRFFELQNHILLVGEQNALEYYPLFDCFAQPSHSEGFSRALLEAMLHKLPIILNDTCAESTFIHNLHCLRIKDNRPEQWVQELMNLEKNPQLRADLGRQAYLLASQEYSYTNMIAHYKEVITKF